MTSKIMYVVYQTVHNPSYEDDIVFAVSDDREVACQIAGELEIFDGGEYWVDDIPVSHSLEEYKGHNGDV